MIRVNLALVIAMASLPACRSAEIMGAGNCRPDIGPGGVLKVKSGGATSFELLKTPLQNYTVYIAGARGSQGVELEDWIKYTLEIDFSGQQPKATLYKNGQPLPENFLTEERPTHHGSGHIALRGNPKFITDDTVALYVKHPNENRMFKTTAYLTRRR